MTPSSVPMRGLVAGTFVAGAMIGWFWAAASSPEKGPRFESPKPEAGAEVPQPSSSTQHRNEFSTRLQKALATRSKLKRARAIASVADDLSPQQIRDALDLTQRTHVPDREAILMTLFKHWGELEPEAAMAYARQAKDEFMHRSIVEVAKGWARRDFDAAFAAARRMPIGEVQAWATAGVLKVLSETDPKAAFELAKQTETIMISETIFENWVERNPEEAASYAVKLAADDKRNNAMAFVARKWANIDPHGMLRWVESLPDSDAVGSTVWNSPATYLFLTWADEDPEAAVRWLEQMPDGSRKTGIANLINGEIGYRLEDPEIFKRVVAIVPQGRERNGAWGNFMNWWGETDPSSAIAWARMQPGDVQEATIPILARKMSLSDHLAALELAATLPEKAKNDLTEDVVGWWAIKDPAAAAKWVEQHPPKVAHLKGVALAWISKDLATATEWVNTIQPGPIKDEMLAEVVEQVQKHNPQLACAWIEGISDEKQRQVAYKELGCWWIYVDPAAAGAWLKSAPVPELLKEEVLSAIKK
jgi:hypothetical protein